MADSTSSVSASGLPAAGLLQLAGAVVLLGGAWPITKWALQSGAAPMAFATGRAALSAFTTFAALAAFGRVRIPARRDLPIIATIGVLQLALFFALAHAAVGFVAAGRTAVLSNTTTIWIVPLSLVFLREPIPVRRWIAAGLGLCGVVVLIGPWSIDYGASGVLFGHALLLMASLSWSLAIIAVRRRPARASMFELLPWCFLLASFLLLPVPLIEGFGSWPPPSLECLAFIGLVAGPIGTWCVVQATATLPAMVASTGFLATPAVGLILSALVLGELLTWDLLLGSALVMAGVAVAALPRFSFAK